MACKVAIAALEVVKNEKLAENADRLGKIFREEIGKIKTDSIELVRGQRIAQCRNYQTKTRKNSMGCLRSHEGKRINRKANPRPHHQICTTIGNQRNSIERSN
jgi:Ornithine/acetylornithine aminotransferase